MTDLAVLARGIVVAGVPDADAVAAHPPLAGYVFFARNGESVRELRPLADALRARAGDLPPLLAIDQEGGRVARLREGVEPMPPMMSLGAAGDLELAGRAGEQVAFDLRRAGCNLDFAPVLDLALDARNVAIGTRSLGSDPQRVAALGMAFAGGMQRGGMLSCAKHFPGHGATGTDSHVALPVLEGDARTLRERDLVPFAAAARSVPAMMSAHVVVPALDPQRPATLSPAVMTDLLRGDLAFEGVAFTDCLEMKALDATGGVRRALAALAAGADALLFSHDFALALETVDAIVAAVNGGALPQERLEEAYGRVQKLRTMTAAPLDADAFPPHPGVGREIARRGVTLVRGVPHADPLASLAVAFGAERATLAREAPALVELLAPVDPGEEDVRAILEALAKSGRRPLLLTQRAHLHAAQARAVRAIVEGYPDALVASLAEPFDLPLFGAARHLIAAYGDDAAATGGLADVLFGGSMPQGRLPVDLASASAAL